MVEIPPVHSNILSISGACDDDSTGLPLLLDKLGDNLGMVRFRYPAIKVAKKPKLRTGEGASVSWSRARRLPWLWSNSSS